MSKSLAPRMPWGCSWMWLWLMLGGALAPDLPAQTGAGRRHRRRRPPRSRRPSPLRRRRRRGPPARDEAEAKKRAAQPEAGEDEPEGLTPTSPETKKAEPPETFLDPRAKEALENKFPQVGSRTNAQVISRVKAMARGESQPDPATLRSFVDGMMLS